MAKLSKIMRSFLSWNIKRSFRQVRRQFKLRPAIRRTILLAEREIPTQEILAALRKGWDNKGWPASVGYLQEMSNLAVKTRGPILECGTGITTILLGLLCQKRGVKVWSLEHNVECYSCVEKTLKKFRIENVKLCLVPLVEYGDYTWYDPPVKEMPKDFHFVVCDGPPRRTGGRYGLLPVMGKYVARDCIILLDNTDREGEKKIIKQWEKDFNVRIKLVGSHDAFAVITLS